VAKAGSRRSIFGGGRAAVSAALVSLSCVVALAACSGRKVPAPRAVDTVPSPASPAAALPAAATGDAAAPFDGPPPAMVRVAMAKVAASARMGLAPTTAGAAVALPSAQGKWEVLWFDRAGQVRRRDSSQLEAKGSEPLLASAGAAAWLGVRGGTDLLYLAPGGPPRARKLPAGSLALLGQGDGDAVAVLAAGDGARLVRLDRDGMPRWDRAVALPGAATLATATLRDDILLLGQRSGAPGGWYAARISPVDGKVLWLRLLEPAALPLGVEWSAATMAPRGAGLLVSLARSDSRRDEPWTLMELDANGQLGWRTTLARTSPTATASGDSQRVLVAQGRSGGVQVHSYDGAGRAVSTWTADWRGLEVPQAVASGPDGEVWCVSLAPHADGEQATALVTRWAIERPQRPLPCAPTGCSATRRDPDGCATVQLPDGAPCSPLSRCRAGLCGGPRPAPSAAPSE
jgi:hypothetical protein